MSRASVAREITQVESVIAESGREQNAAPLVVPPGRAFRNVRVGRQWYVFFGDLPVAAGPTRKRAGRMAVLGNDFLRRLQRQGAVDVNALASQFSAYLVAASAIDGGFVPPIRAFPQ